MFARSLALAALCGMSFAASAVTVDLRHEFIDGGKSDKSNADRVSVSHRFDNGFGFSVEAKWKSGGDNASQPYSDVVGNGHEETISWRWKADKNFAVTPGFVIESNDSRSIYKPNLHVQYSFDKYNLKVAYKLDKNWAPYGELGNVGVNDRSDRQTRFRVGVAYSF